MCFLFLNNIGLQEIFIIAFIYLVFFGTNNLPSLMRDFGRVVYKIRNFISDSYQDFGLDNDKEKL